MDSGTLAAPQRDEAAPSQWCGVTSLVWPVRMRCGCWALPLFAVTGIWLGIRRGRLRRVALVWRLAVVTLLAVGLAEPMIALGSATGGAVFVVDRSASIDAEARDAATVAEGRPGRRASHAPGRHRGLRRQTGAGYGAGVRARSPSSTTLKYKRSRWRRSRSRVQ